uniref:Uncharacterized protein n=1 Tax=Arundo donax TaxID=35708 RepID=A0A0A8ZFV0_ARUDO
MFLPAVLQISTTSLHMVEILSPR